jgi:hypothetical protein
MKWRLKLMKTLEKEKLDCVKKSGLIKIKGPLAKDVAGARAKNPRPPARPPRACYPDDF